MFSSVTYFMRLLSLSVVSDSLRPRGLQPARLLCPWDSPGKNTGVGCHFLLQGIFPTQGLNPCLLRCRQILSTEPPGKPLCFIHSIDSIHALILISPFSLCILPAWCPYICCLQLCLSLCFANKFVSKVRLLREMKRWLYIYIYICSHNVFPRSEPSIHRDSEGL